jgi:hypothetical protein
MHKQLYFALTVIVAGGCAQGSDDGVPLGLPSDTLWAEGLTVIGDVDGAPEYLFGDVASVAVGPNQIIYVADHIGATVRAYNLKGEFLGTIGSEGDGPNEFRFPHDLTFDAAGRLYVRQRYRVTVFGPSGSGEQLRDLPIRTIPLQRPALESARAKVLEEHYYSPSYYYFMFVRHRYFYEILDSTGATGDTLPVPGIPNPEVFSRATYSVGDGSSRMPVDGLNSAPFEPRPSWDISPQGDVLMTLGAKYEVFAIDPSGDTVSIINVETEPQPVPPDELRDSTRAFRLRVDSLPVPLGQMFGVSEVAESGRLPGTLPEVTALQVLAPSGNIWVTRWPTDGQTIFDVFDAAGLPLRTVRVPATLVAGVPPYLSSTLILGVVRDPMTGVERVAAFSLDGG